MFIALLIGAAIAGVAGALASREAMRSGASREALTTLVLVALVCGLAMSAQAPIVAPVVLAAGVGATLPLRRARAAARPTPTPISLRPQPGDDAQDVSRRAA